MTGKGKFYIAIGIEKSTLFRDIIMWIGGWMASKSAFEMSPSNFYFIK